jgi:hypothetical protein
LTSTVRAAFREIAFLSEVPSGRVPPIVVLSEAENIAATAHAIMIM